MKRILPVFFCFVITFNYAVAQPCDCEENYHSLQQMLKTNYPGFMDKAQGNEYKNFSAKILAKAKGLANNYDCYLTLKALTGFFKDPHLTFNINYTGANKTSIQQMFSTLPASHSGRVTDNHIAADEALVGDWELKGQGTYYRISLNKNKTGAYEGRVVAADTIFWYPGQIKCLITAKNKDRYTVTLFVKDHTPVTVYINYRNNDLLDMGNYGLWQRVSRAGNNAVLDSIVRNKNKIELKRLSPRAVYLRIPSFDIANYQSLRDVLGKKELTQDLSDQHLVIDLRNNSGGSTVVSSMLLKYVYNGPIQMPGSMIRNSKQNIDDFEKMINRPAFSSLDQPKMAERISKLRSLPDTLVSFTERKTITLDSVYNKPRNIYILVNGGSASTTEYFVLQARQNNRVHIVGQHTRGAIDYTDVGLPHVLPCPLFYYQGPMTRSNRLNNMRLDNIGITPDIKVPDEEDALGYIKQLIHE